MSASLPGGDDLHAVPVIQSLFRPESGGNEILIHRRRDLGLAIALLDQQHVERLGGGLLYGSVNRDLHDKTPVVHSRAPSARRPSAPLQVTTGSRGGRGR